MSDRVYYRDDVTLLPIAAIWRLSWRLPLFVSLPVFTLFLIRKLLGWRFAATSGTPRPDRLPEIDEEEVPARIRDELEPALHACRAAGFEVMFWIRPNYIGGKQGFMCYLLHEQGQVFATPFWLRVTVRGQTRTNVVFSCHSCRADGVDLHTGTLAEEHWIPEMIPPDVEFMRLPIDTPPGTVILQHQRRFMGGADLIRFDRASLAAKVVHDAQRVIDFLVEKGIYMPVSEPEVERLQQR
jgi:hypothetical protein